jgi:uncharacterized protein YidB (DUF937 family)
MGLLNDILGSALGGTSASSDNAPGAPSESSGSGLSPALLGILALMAYKALKSGGATAQAAPAPNPQASGADDGGGGGGLGDILGGLMRGGGGGLGDILKGPLGSVLAGGAAGGALSGGLSDVLKQLEQSGHGDVAKSWVSNGPNQTIQPKELEDALGRNTMKSLAEQAGLSQVELTSRLSQGLPQVIDRLTPQGRVPTADEAARML